MVDKKSLTRSSNSEIDAFLATVSSTPVTRTPGKRGRLMFAMDATASREPTWDRACHIQAQMFEETASLGGLNIQLCYYRGFKEFEASDWFGDTQALLQCMTSVHCLGGHTQIASVIGHAITETMREKVNALVFVGDCMEENLDHLCDLAGKLGIHGVPAFMFQEGNDPVTESAFRQIAKLTKGAFCHFDANSANQLRDLLNAVAVYAAGGRIALEQFSKHKDGNILKIVHQIKGPDVP